MVHDKKNKAALYFLHTTLKKLKAVLKCANSLTKGGAVLSQCELCDCPLGSGNMYTVWLRRTQTLHELCAVCARAVSESIWMRYKRGNSNNPSDNALPGEITPEDLIYALKALRQSSDISPSQYFRP